MDVECVISTKIDCNLIKEQKPSLYAHFFLES